eukprot:16104450-Heterocapsa_arctica.AAC.1
MMGYTAPTWEKRVMRIPQVSLVDARSLRDHLHKTGSMPTEKRVGLDLADVHEWLDRGDKLFWIPTGYML